MKDSTRKMAQDLFVHLVASGGDGSPMSHDDAYDLAKMCLGYAGDYESAEDDVREKERLAIEEFEQLQKMRRVRR